MWLILILLGGWISRMSGGGWPKLPFGTDQIFYAMPYGAITFLALLSTSGGLFSSYPWHIWYLSLIAFICAVIGKRQANREYMDLGTWKGVLRKPHRYTAFLGWLKGRIPEYVYDWIGLFFVGLAVALVPSVIIAYVNPLAGLVLASGGACKAAAYQIGWKQSKFKPTELGEFLTGVFGYAGIILCYILLPLEAFDIY